MPECTREEPELHARFVPKPLMMDAQTADASAVRRYALSMVVQSKHVSALLHQPGTRQRHGIQKIFFTIDSLAQVFI